MVLQTTFLMKKKLNQVTLTLKGVNMKNVSKMNKVIFQSYTDVINKGIRAGKDMSVAAKRLNHLMSEHKKTI